MSKQSVWQLSNFAEQCSNVELWSYTLYKFQKWMGMKVKMIHHDFYHPNVKDSTLLFNKYKLQSNAHFSRSWQANCTAQEHNFFVPWSLKHESRKKVWKSGGASSNVVGNLSPPYLQNLGGRPLPTAPRSPGSDGIEYWDEIFPDSGFFPELMLYSRLKNLETHFLFTWIRTFRKVPFKVCSKM